MSLLSSLSIVIPTFNRQEYVLRTMRYWSDYDVTVYVFDGTQVPIDDHLISVMGSNINYHHMPCCLMERLNKSIEVVYTKYSKMMADDEFIIPSALESCIEEMNNNEEIVSCVGSAITFRVVDKEVVSSEIYHKLRENSLMQDAPSARSIFHMSNFRPLTIYSVMRTDVWKKSIRSLSYKNYEVFVKSIGELQFEITSSYLGKVKIINELMWLRSFENEPCRVHEGESSVPIQDFWYKESNKSIRDEIIDTIVQSIASEEDNESLIAHDVSQAFDAYLLNLKTYLLNRKINEKSFKFRTYRTLKAILPKSVLSLIVRLLKLMKVIENNSLWNYRALLKLASILDKDDIKVDIVALEEIEKIVLDFHSKPKA